ncbi:hypothetical protein LINPERHAP1_LOCUS24237 [Linum perenne]
MSRNHKWRFLCDGSFKGGIQEAGIGIIVVSPEGRVVDGVACRFLCRDAVVAEAYAVLTACKLAVREGVEAEIWSDCLAVTHACCNRDEISPWECSVIVEEIKNQMDESTLISIVKCNRSSVSIADRIAKQVREKRLEPNWISPLLGSYVD